MNFIVWCSAECTVRVLDAAQRVGMLSERHSYIALSLDLHTQALADYSHGGANITGLRLFDPESPDVAAVVAEWALHYKEEAGEAATDVEELVAAPPTALLLAQLGASLAAQAWRRLNLPDIPADEDVRVGAFHADTLLNYLRSEEWESPAHGAVSWEADGGRRALQLQVVELARGGALQRAGQWAPGAGLTWHRAELPAAAPPPDSMVNRTFTVLIAENKPYVMKQESTLRLSGNERYEGFCIELIQRLAELLKFNYTFVEQNGSYGSRDNVTGKWDGMLGRLMEDQHIDFAITDLTMTAERERAVDFTTPFMNLGISILFRAPKQPEPKLFAFLHPFSNGVWLCLGFAYLGTSLLLYVVGRLCHEEWQNPYPCIDDPPALENQFTLANALWFNLGAILQQGSEIAPVAYGTRAVASVWWVFALVITSSYTANLATLLAKKSPNELIHSVNDLANNQLGIEYGAKAGGSTYTFFEHSENKLYRDMFEHMKQHKMPDSNPEGIQKVMTENYAFLMESTTIDYEIERNCQVIKVGSLLDSKGYGIAMKKNSTFRQALNLGLLNLQEAGTLREMQETWWKKKHGGGACKQVEDRESEKLSMMNFLGLFLVLVVGSALGLVLSCCDLAWGAVRRARLNGEPVHVRFWKELRFVFSFERSERPLQGSLGGSSRGSAGSARSAGSAASGAEETAGSAAADEEAEEAVRSLRTRSGSLASRRRSSMHAASVRRARHTAAHSHTPAPRR
ncbi:glutamate receptor ionotropic, kainate 2-like [Anticarsia gemmatalis]|uniref:glutamate receptor ionotropic, kainate 2-like n=1 Tax=Anticarsia gemmatalis TaxID=129554 RepID=UPI003F76D0FB